MKSKLPFGALSERLAERLGEAEAPARASAFLSGWQRDGLLSRPAPA